MGISYHIPQPLLAQNYELYSKCKEILLFPLGDVATRVLSSFSLTGFTSAKSPIRSNFKKNFIKDAWIKSETGK